MEVVDGTALMLHMAPNVRGRVAQVVACLGRACEGIGRVAVVFSKFIDSRSVHTPQHDESDTHMPTIETDVDVPVAEVAEVNDAVELALSIVCYCGSLWRATKYGSGLADGMESGSYGAHTIITLTCNAPSSAYVVWLYADSGWAMAALPSMRALPLIQ